MLYCIFMTASETNLYELGNQASRLFADRAEAFELDKTTGGRISELNFILKSHFPTKIERIQAKISIEKGYVPRGGDPARDEVYAEVNQLAITSYEKLLNKTYGGKLAMLLWSCLSSPTSQAHLTLQQKMQHNILIIMKAPTTI